MAEIDELKTRVEIGSGQNDVMPVRLIPGLWLISNQNLEI